MSGSGSDVDFTDGSDDDATEETLIDAENSARNESEAFPIPEKTNLVMFLNLLHWNVFA